MIAAMQIEPNPLHQPVRDTRRLRVVEPPPPLPPEPAELTDGELMARVAADHNREAFDELYTRHHRALERFAHRLTGDAFTAEDLFQETMLKVFNHAESFTPGAPFLPWAYRIMRNVHIDEIRRRKRQPAVASDFATDDDADHGWLGSTTDETSPETRSIQRQAIDTLQGRLEQLPDEQREVFVLHKLEGRKYDWIARALGIPVGTVKSRMFAAVHALMAVVAEAA